MYARSLVSPEYSFFLFGPRGTGKTTWLRQKFPNALWKNLLLDSDYLPLLGDTKQLSSEVQALAPGSWVVIDEIQKIPALLNEVHNLVSLYNQQYKFALSGSSARKLKRLDVNLLAGRAIERNMFPFTRNELQSDFDLEKVLAYGSLPIVVENSNYAVDILNTYVATYLKQEIQQEALVEDVGAFHRFLKVAGIMNSEPINISGVARDAAVARTTAERYFDILIDTLIGYRLPGWQPQIKVKEKSSAKFYLFDTGVARACVNRLRDPLSDLEVGALLETYILHELRCAIAYQNLGGELFYWRSGGGAEVDFVWERSNKAVAIEVKASSKWRRNYGKALQSFAATDRNIRCYGVYNGAEVLQFGEVQVLPVEKFLAALSAGEILV